MGNYTAKASLRGGFCKKECGDDYLRRAVLRFAGAFFATFLTVFFAAFFTAFFAVFFAGRFLATAFFTVFLAAFFAVFFFGAIRLERFR